MDVFLKSIDNKTLKVMIKGWKHPVITFQDGTTSLKSIAECIDAKDNEALGLMQKTFKILFSMVFTITCLD